MMLRMAVFSFQMLNAAEHYNVPSLRSAAVAYIAANAEKLGATGTVQEPQVGLTLRLLKEARNKMPLEDLAVELIFGKHLPPKTDIRYARL